MTADSPFPRHTFVLKVNDRPGAMELIAATFAHRGVSLHSLLGNDDTLGADGLATVLVTFSAPPARKEALRGALGRLSRIVSLTERTDAAHLRKSALIRVAPATLLPDAPLYHTEKIAADESGDTYAVLGEPADVDALLHSLKDAGALRGVTQTILAL